MKLLSFVFTLLLATSGMAQTNILYPVAGNEYPLAASSIEFHRDGIVSETPKRSSINLSAIISDDSLWAKRSFLTTAVYQKEGRVSNAALIEKLQTVPKALAKFRLASILKYIGPVVAISGLFVSYVGIKGNTSVKTLSGQQTPLNPNGPDEIQVDYTERSLPKVLGGVGLFLGGLCLIEVSNELTAKSILLYNAKASSPKSLSRVDQIKLGVTTSGNFGLEAHF